MCRNWRENTYNSISVDGSEGGRGGLRTNILMITFELRPRRK